MVKKVRGTVSGRVWEITDDDIHYVPDVEGMEPGELSALLEREGYGQEFGVLYCDVEGERIYLEPDDFYIEIEGRRFFFGFECIFDFYPPEDIEGWISKEFIDIEGW